MIRIDYFSDVLCIWAYGGQVRLDELQKTFGDEVLVRHRFMALFADTQTRIGDGWAGDGGFDGFGRHMQEVCEQWPHAHLNADAWTRCRPCSSTTAHVFLKAAGLLLGVDDEQPYRGACAVHERLVTRVRTAFFEQGQDVASLAVLAQLLDGDMPSFESIRDRIDNGTAYAALHRDEELRKAHGVVGSPTYVFNEGRQLLYGNVGYRIIEANVRELLSRPQVEGVPSWC
ncbi:MAG: DsbA family protein [Gammaproteobacteria bacterium]|nr:DsbA family protein [Gammaproteobacteria bacterium]